MIRDEYKEAALHELEKATKEYEIEQIINQSMSNFRKMICTDTLLLFTCMFYKTYHNASSSYENFLALFMPGSL